MQEMHIEAKIIQGEREASGLAHGNIERGTIALQKPYLLAAGVRRIESCYNGTINLSIAPREFKILKPDYTVTASWEPGVTETFWLVDVVLKHKERKYPAYIYYPLPSSIKAHPDSVIEILSEKIDTLHYGDTVVVTFPTNSISIINV